MCITSPPDAPSLVDELREMADWEAHEAAGFGRVAADAMSADGEWPEESSYSVEAAHYARRALAMRAAADRLDALTAERDALAARLVALATLPDEIEALDDCSDYGPFYYGRAAELVRATLEGRETE